MLKHIKPKAIKDKQITQYTDFKFVVEQLFLNYPTLFGTYEPFPELEIVDDVPLDRASDLLMSGLMQLNSMANHVLAVVRERFGWEIILCLAPGPNTPKNETFKPCIRVVNHRTGVTDTYKTRNDYIAAKEQALYIVLEDLVEVQSEL